MLFALAALEIVTFIAVVVLLLRRPANAATADPRLEALITADLPGQLARLDAKFASTEQHLRAEVGGLRREASEDAARLRSQTETAHRELRTEVQGSIQTLGTTLNDGLTSFRADNKTDAETLRKNVEGQLASLQQRLVGFTSETTRTLSDSREALHTRLNELSAAQVAEQSKLRDAMQQRLDKLNEDNAAKLEQMRATVDEKLQATLHTRLTESFGAVTEQLASVHKGLGEMTTLATGVGDLKRVLSNVKSRGIVGEFFLGQQLEQMFSPDQYEVNARIKPNTQESVEFALKVPNGPDSTVLLALDSKFPVEDWERLEDAYENGNDEDRKKASTAFERAIRNEGKRICEKYIDPPATLPFAIMYLPTEALYAEVMRRPGLHAEVQQQCNVVIAGPSAFTMILTSFQLVFRTVKFQKNLHDVHSVFQKAQTEFEKFGGLMEKVEKQVGTVQNTLGEISRKTKTVNRAFKNVNKLDMGTPLVGDTVGQNVLQLLSASEDEETPEE
ncbi:DNA recombination protein RmuC [Granulicella cerasi]|uniref:DNA recombination protein RmuC n=1 Tax=Granulicella cerasi TaxID=741063 RepID=A0ABW1Z9A0_9BACT|nr:DNA recombination protein RmuC [Granulicella cerasi]